MLRLFGAASLLFLFSSHSFSNATPVPESITKTSNNTVPVIDPVVAIPACCDGASISVDKSFVSIS